LTQADVLAPPPLQRPARSEPHDLFFYDYESPHEIGERPDRGENEGKVLAGSACGIIWRNLLVEGK
jgi:hypothetical protein